MDKKLDIMIAIVLFLIIVILGIVIGYFLFRSI